MWPKLIFRRETWSAASMGCRLRCAQNTARRMISNELVPFVAVAASRLGHPTGAPHPHRPDYSGAQIFILSLEQRASSHLEFICGQGHIVRQAYADRAMPAFAARPFVTIANLVGRLSTLTVELCRIVRSVILRPYHPEQHYMRGPGPKWHEKHPAAGITSVNAT
jgi:hypothetical protein